MEKMTGLGPTFDHVVTSLVNQAEEDKDAGIPLI